MENLNKQPNLEYCHNFKVLPAKEVSGESPELNEAYFLVYFQISAENMKVMV